MSKSSREIVAALVQDGWIEVGQTGSHRHFKHPAKPGKVTIPHPKDHEKYREGVGGQAVSMIVRNRNSR